MSEVVTLVYSFGLYYLNKNSKVSPYHRKELTDQIISADLGGLLVIKITFSSLGVLCEIEGNDLPIPDDSSVS